MKKVFLALAVIAATAPIYVGCKRLNEGMANVDAQTIDTIKVDSVKVDTVAVDTVKVK